MLMATEESPIISLECGTRRLQNSHPRYLYAKKASEIGSAECRPGKKKTIVFVFPNISAICSAELTALPTAFQSVVTYSHFGKLPGVGSFASSEGRHWK